MERLTLPAVKWPRFTIARLRILVLAGGVALVAAIAIFLGVGQWQRYRQLKDLPKRLGIDIQQRADGVDYTQSRKGKTLFKIHAARAVQMKKDGTTLLHDVRIDLYGEDGSRTDTISGSDFEYDPGTGMARADGAVEIAIMRPDVRPVIAQQIGKPAERLSGIAIANQGSGIKTGDDEIHVKTSGLLFNQHSGVATTAQRVDFALKQGSGSSTGATYDSSKGHLVLDRDVELHVQRLGGPVTVNARHGEFERVQQVCNLTQARAEYSGGVVQMVDALIHFRDDGTVRRLDGSGGVDLQSKTGTHVTAPRGTVDFDEDNRPSRGLLEGGAKLDVTQPARHVEAASPTVQLAFDGQGLLHKAHLQQGVLFASVQQVATAKNGTVEMRRSWKSQTADVEFASSEHRQGAQPAGPGQSTSKPGQTQSSVEPRKIHGTGGVLITSETSELAPNKSGTNTHATGPMSLAADTVDAVLAPGAVLSSLSGRGHAVFDQRNAQGVQQSSQSDQLDVRFAANPASARPGSKAVNKSAGVTQDATQTAEIESVKQVGHVVLTQEAAKAKPGRTAAQSDRAGSAVSGGSALKATASASDYDGVTQILRLYGAPRVHDGTMDMTADRIDLSRGSGDAVAVGNVKASWVSQPGEQAALPGSSLLGDHKSAGGGSAPIHAVGAIAELHQASGEVIFRQASDKTATGKTQTEGEPRLWQEADSVTAPTIVINRPKQTLNAMADGAANQVRTVLMTTPGERSSANTRKTAQATVARSTVIRLTSGELHYSEGERIAHLESGTMGAVTAQTSDAGGSATVVAQRADVTLVPAAVQHAPTVAGAGATRSTSLNQLIALGKVVVDWPGRKGTGDKLVYLSEQDTFTLTGSSAAPPRITDQLRGTVTGSALIYHGRDDSVTVEGDGSKTVTVTQTQK